MKVYFCTVKKWLTINNWGLLLVLILFSIGLLFVQKGEAVLWLNTYHNPLLNKLNHFITRIVEFPIIVFILFGAALHRYSLTAVVLISYTLTGVFVQFLKKFIFSGERRPFHFYNDESINLVEGIEMITHNSFPSGHTAVGFAIAVSFAAYLDTKLSYLLCLMLAILVGCSRIYLVLHFYQDVVVGAWIGSLIAIIVQHFFRANQRNKPWYHKGILNKSKA